MAHKILAALLIVALAVFILVSGRSLVLGNRETVADVMAIPEGKTEILSSLETIVDDYGVHMLHAPTKAELLYRTLAAAGRMPIAAEPAKHVTQRPRYGYSIIEYSLFGMPFGWSANEGYVLYTDDRDELVTAKLTDYAEAKFRQELGRDPAEGFIFPFWAHMWGWAYVAAIGLWIWLYLRHAQRRREELGMI